MRLRDWEFVSKKKKDPSFVSGERKRRRVKIKEERCEQANENFPGTSQGQNHPSVVEIHRTVSLPEGQSGALNLQEQVRFVFICYNCCYGILHFSFNQFFQFLKHVCAISF